MGATREKNGGGERNIFDADILTIKRGLGRHGKMKKYPTDINLKATGSEFQTRPISRVVKHDDEVDEEHAKGSVVLKGFNFDIRCTYVLNFGHQFLCSVVLLE